LLEGLADYVLTSHGDVERLTDVEPLELPLRLADYRVRFLRPQRLDPDTSRIA
jgi:hypothetical protein